MAEKRTIELEIQDNSKSLKAQYKEAVAELQKVSAQYGETSAEAIKAAKAAADLKDQIAFSKDLVDSFNPDAKFTAVSKSIGGVLDGFQAFEGVLGLVGVESENLQKTMLKVQSAMALSQGIQGVMEAKDSFKQFGTVVSDAFGKMTTAGKAFAVTGIGLVVTAIGYAIANWDKLKESISNQTVAQQISNQVTKEAISTITAELSAADKLSKQLKNETLSRTEKVQKIKEFQAAYPGLLKNINLETMSISQINGQLEKNIKLLTLQAKQKAIASIREKEYEKSIIAQTNSMEDNLGTYGTISTAITGFLGLQEENKDEYEKIANYNKQNAIKEANTRINALDKMDAALQKEMAALSQQGAQVESNSSAMIDYSKSAATFTTAVNNQTTAVEKLNLTRELEDKRISLMEEGFEKEKALLLLRAKREKEDLAERSKGKIVDAKQVAEAKQLIEDNMLVSLGQLTDKYSAIEYQKEAERLAKEKELKDKILRDELKRQNDLLNETEAFTEERQTLALSDQEKELRSLNDWLFEKENAHKDNFDALEDIHTIYLEKKKKIDKKYEDEEKQRQSDLAKAKVKIALDSLQLVSNITELFGRQNEKRARIAFQVDKAAKLASATIAGVEGTIEAYKTAQKSPITTVFPAYPIIQAGLAGAFAATNIAKIAQAKFGGVSGSEAKPDGGSGGGGGGMTAQFNTIGTSGINQLATLQQQPVQAYVVSGEVTSAQSLDRNRVQNATL